MYSLMGMVAGVTANFGPFCGKDFLLALFPSWKGKLPTCPGYLRHRRGNSSFESVGCLGGHLGACGGSGDEVLQLLDLGVLVL